MNIIREKALKDENYNMIIYYKIRNRSIRRKNSRSRSCKSITKRHLRGGNLEQPNPEQPNPEQPTIATSGTDVVIPNKNCSWWQRTFYGCPQAVVGGRKKRNMSVKKRRVSFK